MARVLALARRRLVRRSGSPLQPLDLARHRDLVIAYGLIAAAFALAPVDRAHWAAEHIMVVGLAGTLWLGRDRVRLSRFSAWSLLTFLCLHEIGAHYTYAGVPYDDWLRTLTGTTLEETFGVERNHYDRLVHLAFGLLLAWPVREVLVQLTPLEGRWSYLLTTAVMMAAAMAYEVAEWLAVLVAAPADGGAAMLGMQGDVWDSQKDMALAAAGAMLALTIAVNLRDRRFFSARAGDHRRVLDPHRPDEEFPAIEPQHLAGAAHLGVPEAVHQRDAGLGHHVGPGVAVGRGGLGPHLAGHDLPALGLPVTAGRDQHRPERRPRGRARFADEGPVGGVGGGDRLLGQVGVRVELATLPGADQARRIDHVHRVHDGRHRPPRRLAAAGAGGEEQRAAADDTSSHPDPHRSYPAD